MASWLVCSSTDRAVRVRALAGDIVLCSWARHFTLTVPLSTQEYKWVPVICWGNLTNCWGLTCDGLASRPGGVEILLAASCYGNRDKLGPDEPVGSIRLHFHFTLLLTAYIKFYWHFTQTKIGPILVYTRSFKSFALTGANQELSFPTHVTQHLAVRKISSDSDSNIA